MSAPKRSRNVSKLSWREIEEINKNKSLLVIPVGATEQHGHHLPIETDSRIVYEIVKQSAEGLPDEVNVLYTPVIWFGYSEHHQGFPGLFSLKGDTLKRLVMDICIRAHKEGFKKIMLVNGHGGNVLYLSAASREMYDELGLKIGIVTYWDLITAEITENRDSPLGGINHACELETSLMLYLDEASVRKEQIHDNPIKKGKYNRADLLDSGILFAGGNFKDISDTGVVGMPSLANRDKGEKIFKAGVKRMQELFLDYLQS